MTMMIMLLLLPATTAEIAFPAAPSTQLLRCPVSTVIHILTRARALWKDTQQVARRQFGT